MDITDTKHGDYFYPDLLPTQEEPATYGKYGLLRKRYLKEHRRATYTTLLTTGQLTHHLNEVDAQAREMVETLTAQIAQAQNVTEQLKAQDQFAWVGAMNNIHNAAEEIALAELVCQ